MSVTFVSTSAFESPHPARPAYAFRRETFPAQLDRDRLPGDLAALYRTTRAMCGSREDAEDLVQDTLVNVLASPLFYPGAPAAPTNTVDARKILNQTTAVC